jgi:hypothetical protein
MELWVSEKELKTIFSIKMEHIPYGPPIKEGKSTMVNFQETKGTALIHSLCISILKIIGLGFSSSRLKLRTGLLRTTHSKAWYR